jgi:hypothetical protein
VASSSEELERYTAELKQLLAGPDLSPDTRARSLAALIEADAADKLQGAFVGLDEHALILASALGRLPDR